MRILFYLLLVLSSACIICCSSSYSIDLTEEETEWLGNNIDRIELVPDPSFLPFEGFDKTGRFIGIGADFLSEIEKRLNCKFRIRQVDDWSTALNLLKEGRSSGVLSIVKTPEREEYINFTDPYINVPVVILSREELKAFNTLNRALLYKSGIAVDYPYYEAVKEKYPYLKFVDFKTDAEAIRQLSYGNIDLLAINIASAEYYIREYGLTNLKVSGETELSLKLSIGLNRQMPQLYSIFQKVLSSIPENEKKQIIDKWINFQNPWYVKYPKLFIVLIVNGVVLLTALAATALTVLVNKTLKKRVAAKTAELSKTEEFLKDLLEIIPDPVFVKTSTHEFILINKAYSKLLGKNPEEVIGKTEFELFPKEDAQRFVDSDLQVLKSNLVLEYEDIHVDPEGVVHQLLAKKTALTNYSGEKNIVTILHDITELREKEKELMQSQKMETIGRLSSGFAHDFNNILGGITGPVELIEYALVEGNQLPKEQILEYTSLVKKASDRAKKIIQQLLSISKNKTRNFRPVNINESVKNVLEIASHSFDKQIEIRALLSDTPSYIKGDYSMLEQVILNILINAYHSMTIMRGKNEQHGGTITIEISKKTFKNVFTSETTGTTVFPGKYNTLKISDTGTGIDKQTRKLIFEPFFSTKKGDGSGLGLTMVMNIVNSLKGAIEIESEEGKGTDFILYFPEISPDSADESAGENIIRGSGNIIIIDDEENIREAASAMLGFCGYTTKCFSGGEEAVAYLKENSNSADLVLLDLILPGMSAENIFKSIKEINPSIPFILTSGFTENDRIKSLLSEGISLFISKPFTIRELSEKTAAVLFMKE